MFKASGRLLSRLYITNQMSNVVLQKMCPQSKRRLLFSLFVYCSNTTKSVERKRDAAFSLLVLCSTLRKKCVENKREASF